MQEKVLRCSGDVDLRTIWLESRQAGARL